MRIAWIDVESTGIDASKQKLLQVACLVTDGELNLLDDEGFSAEIFYASNEVAALKSNVDDYVLNMHTQTGLWDKLPYGRPLAEVDSELKKYLAQFVGEKEAYLGGNSITLDRNFINAYLPVSGDYLHYRSIDVSTIAILAEEWYHGLSYEKKYLHDAKSDILESLEQLRFFRNTVFK